MSKLVVYNGPKWDMFAELIRSMLTDLRRLIPNGQFDAEAVHVINKYYIVNLYNQIPTERQYYSERVYCTMDDKACRALNRIVRKYSKWRHGAELVIFDIQLRAFDYKDRKGANQ